MALKDLDPAKFKSFNYPPAPQPQSFESNGTTVTGDKKLIESKFIDPPKANSLDDATTSDDYVGNLGTPQSYQVSNKAGTYTITGLQGEINPDLEVLKSKSLIVKTYDEILSNEEGLFKSFTFTKNNPTFGYQQSPFVLKDFGAASLSSQPERYSDAEIKGHISLTRGGSFTDAMVDDQINLLTETGVLGNFKTNQLLLQSEAIMKGTVLGGNLMSLFNVLQFDSNFIPGNRVYRHGVIGLPLQRYSDPYPHKGGNTPLIKVGATLPSISKDTTIDPTKYTSDDLNTTPKLGYLYNKFMLRQKSEDSTQGFSLTNFVDNLASSMLSDPYPIIPSINVVNSHSLLAAAGNRLYNEEAKYNEKAEHKTTLEKGTAYSFFSKFAPTDFQVSPYESSEGKSKLAEAHDSVDKNQYPRKNIETDIQSKIPKAVDGINKFDGGSALSYKTLGADDNGDIDPGGANSLRYEDTLRSASELNQTIKAELGGEGGERSEGLITQSGPAGDEYIKDNKGARDHYKKKVYAIGRQGLVGIGAVEDGEVFRGAIKMDGNKYVTDAVDKVNIIPYGGRIGEDKGKGQSAKEIHQAAEDLDFIPLVFNDVYNKKAIAFRAIVGDITDTITPEWSENTYVGRPVGTANYKGVGRTIGFDFQVYPKTKQEFPVLLEKVNYLVGQCYPNLDSHLRQTGPIIQLTLGDILNRQLGYLTGVTVTFPSDSTWETDPGLRFTKLINVGVEFSHIGGYVPVATGKHYGLPWLRGSSYDKNGPKFTNYPNRVGTEEENTSGAINNYTELFKDLGQQT
tara:strand:+ start:988 stop:3369 length:2382 start_codon:yes stop_codon:yes gene_type:complete